LRAEQDNREVADLTSLDQRESLKQFVHRAESAGKDNIGVTVFDEHRLTDEEVLERQRTRLISVGRLFEGQFDITADGNPACLKRASVCRFHYSRPAARYHLKVLSRQELAEFAGGDIHLVVLTRTRRTKYRNTPRDRRQIVKTVNDLAHDPEHPPR